MVYILFDDEGHDAMSYEVTIRDDYGYKLGVLRSEELWDIHTGRFLFFFSSYIHEI